MRFNKHSQLLTVIATLLLTTPLWATNGYFTHGTGAKNKAMAGSGLAMPEDAISIANNPAAALANAGKYDAGIAVFSPSRHYKTSESQANGQGNAFTIGPNDIDSSSNAFFIPHIAGTWKLSEESAWGAAFYGRGGMNSLWKGGSATFDPDGPGPAPVTTFPGTYGGSAVPGSGPGGSAGVDFSQAYLDITYSRSLGENFTWGVSLVAVMQVFSARGIGTFAPFTESFVASGGTVQPDSLSNKGHDQGYGVSGRVGVQWDVNEKLSIAGSYIPKIGMSKFKDYSDLFAGGGNMDIPADLKLGLTFRPNPGLALNFDYEKVWYSDAVSIGNEFSRLFSCPSVNPMSSAFGHCLGGKQGAGFGWEDMDVFKIGAQWSSGNDWTWRAGISHGDQPVPESEVMFNILAPGVVEDHFTFGFTREMASGNEMSMAFMYAPNNKVTGINPFDPTQTVTIDMNQFEVEFAWGWR